MASMAYTRLSKPPGPAGERRPPRLAKELGRIKHKKLGIGLVASSCLGLLTYISFARLFATYSPVFESKSLVMRNAPPASMTVVLGMRSLPAQQKSKVDDKDLAEDGTDPKDPIFSEATKINEKEEVVVTKPGGDPKVVDDEADVKLKGTRGGQEEESRMLSKPDPTREMMKLTPKKDENGHKSDKEMLDDEGEGERKGKEGRGHAEKHKVTLATVSNYNIHDEEDTENARQEGTRNVQQGSKALCDFSNFRSNVCEMHGDVRLHPRATSIFYMEPAGSRRDELWKIKPYPRKGDEFCLSHITELTVKSSKVAAECTKYHDVPAVIFSLTGYTGNLFHDFTDVLVPLFTTASEFNGEVQFLITDMALWWTIKYQTVLQKLSKYPLIDFSKDDQVHCFKHAIVGLHAYMEFTIDSSKAPHNYSMADFNRFMRGAYSLGKDTMTVLGEYPKVQPRLLIIKRHRTRMFLNLNEIITMAEELGFEVVIDEANVSSDISGFARLVNSVDIMMGVHGAGLTNCVFLPQNATLIQIVPWGGLDWISRTDFGNPAELMGLRYKQYTISMDESSLTDQYPRDHEIFKNPISFHKRGFEFIRRTFMDKQNVNLDCKRFRPILLEALDNLNP